MMTDTERITALESTIEIILARLDEMSAGYTGPTLPGADDPVVTEPEYQDPSEFWQKFFSSMAVGDAITVSELGTITMQQHYGVKLIALDSPSIQGIQYLGIGAEMAENRSRYNNIFDALFVPECGEGWQHKFRSTANQTGLSTNGTGVPYAFPCAMRSWRKLAE